MSRHVSTVDARDRRVRLAVVAVVWLAGLAAGFFALLSCLARYGCGASGGGLACHNSGTALGVLKVVGVVAVVVAVTVLTYGKPPRTAAIVGAIGLVLLLGCFLGARALLGTV